MKAGNNVAGSLPASVDEGHEEIGGFTQQRPVGPAEYRKLLVFYRVLEASLEEVDSNLRNVLRAGSRPWVLGAHSAEEVPLLTDSPSTLWQLLEIGSLKHGISSFKASSGVSGYHGYEISHPPPLDLELTVKQRVNGKLALLKCAWIQPVCPLLASVTGCCFQRKCNSPGWARFLQTHAACFIASHSLQVIAD